MRTVCQGAVALRHADLLRCPTHERHPDRTCEQKIHNEQAGDAESSDPIRSGEKRRSGDNALEGDEYQNPQHRIPRCKSEAVTADHLPFAISETICAILTASGSARVSVRRHTRPSNDIAFSGEQPPERNEEADRPPATSGWTAAPS